MADASLERLKLLYDYEKFHIGLYGALMAGFITVLKWSDNLDQKIIRAYVVAILFLLAAAFCGAILASSTIDIYNSYKLWPSGTGKEADLRNFWEGRIGPLNIGLFKAKTWWFFGHTAFWVAVMIFIISFVSQAWYWTKPQTPCQCIELRTTTASGAGAPINPTTK
jgi:hypothetical protein